MGVTLYFIRHGEKQKAEKPDELLELTEKGRLQAVKLGKQIRPNPNVAIAFGSPRKRTQETAACVMLARDIDPNASLKDIEEKIAEQVKVGKKIFVDKRLDFNLGKFEAASIKAIIDEGRLIPYWVEESDELALNKNDVEATTYTRQAGNIAEIIKKYVKVAKQFHKIIAEPEKRDKYGNKLERYLGTHLGIVESFVAKIIEKTRGRQEAVKFAGTIPKGFGETKGMRVNIKPDEKTNIAKIGIEYEVNGVKHGIEFDEKLLDEIINERNKFEEKFKQKA